MKRVILVVCLLHCLLPAQQPPKSMTRMVVQLESTEVPADSFAAKPKTMMRAGTEYCRIEEQPDPDRQIHGLVVIHEPDVWMVNLATKTARHIVDPGPTFNCRMPIFDNHAGELPEEEAKRIRALEFGFEIEFFKSMGATPQPGPILQTKQTTAFNLQFGDSSVTLFTYGEPERPLAVAWTRGEKHDIFWYSGYGQIDFDPALFSKPTGVAIEEAKN